MSGISALLGFTAWTLLLVLSVVSYRTLLVVFQGQKANSWTRGAPATLSPALVTRAEHAHANCVENLPVFAAIVLASVALGKQPVVDALAAWVLIFRIAQSVTHLIGVSHWLVFIRAVFYTLQALIYLYLIWGLAA